MKRPHSQRGEVSSRRSRLSTAPQEYLRPHISATSDKPPRITKGVGQWARQNSIRGSSVYLGAIGRHLARHSMARYHRGQGSTSPGPAIHICTHIFFFVFPTDVLFYQCTFLCKIWDFYYLEKNENTCCNLLKTYWTICVTKIGFSLKVSLWYKHFHSLTQLKLS